MTWGELRFWLWRRMMCCFGDHFWICGTDVIDIMEGRDCIVCGKRDEDFPWEPE